jgi:hypothetical protein
MNTVTKRIYIDYTPMKVAKKVTRLLVGRKKNINFNVREKEKYGKHMTPIFDKKYFIQISIKI